LITFIYPNVFKVEVYKEKDKKLVLKTVDEIEKAIMDYLNEQVRLYNSLLQLNSSADSSKSNGYKILNDLGFKKATPQFQTCKGTSCQFHLNDFLC